MTVRFVDESAPVWEPVPAAMLVTMTPSYRPTREHKWAMIVAPFLWAAIILGIIVGAFTVGAGHDAEAPAPAPVTAVDGPAWTVGDQLPKAAPLCRTEDSTGCVRVSSIQGNGEGRSFYAYPDGSVHYLTDARAIALVSSAVDA
jgi:hypothetical protein